MRTNMKLILSLVLTTQILLMAGCSDQKQAKVAINPDDPLARYWNEIIAKRFQESASQSSTAVESAVELSGKYATLSEEAAVLRQKNQQLQEQTAAFESQLRQTQKELAEANDLLIEMRIELNGWKSNILGFREEIRDAETAQLEALLRILKVLGGQTVESAQGESTSPAVAALSNTQQPKP